MCIKRWVKTVYKWILWNNIVLLCFLIDQSRPLFSLFLSFSHNNFNNSNWKSIDGVLGIQTQGHRMVGTDKTTEVATLCVTLFAVLTFWAIRVRIPLKPSVFSVKLVLKKNENKEKRLGLAHFLHFEQFRQEPIS